MCASTFYKLEFCFFDLIYKFSPATSVFFQEIDEIPAGNDGAPVENVSTVTRTTVVTICNGKKTVIRVHPRQPEGVRGPNGGEHVHHHDDESGSSTGTEGEEGEYEYEYEEQDHSETENERSGEDAVETGTVALPNQTLVNDAATKDHLRLHFQQVAKLHGGLRKVEHSKAHCIGMQSRGAPGLHSKVITKTVQ